MTRDYPDINALDEYMIETTQLKGPCQIVSVDMSTGSMVLRDILTGKTVEITVRQFAKLRANGSARRLFNDPVHQDWPRRLERFEPVHPFFEHADCDRVLSNLLEAGHERGIGSRNEHARPRVNRAVFLTLSETSGASSANFYCLDVVDASTGQRAILDVSALTSFPTQNQSSADGNEDVEREPHKARGI